MISISTIKNTSKTGSVYDATHDHTFDLFSWAKRVGGWVGGGRRRSNKGEQSRDKEELSGPMQNILKKTKALTSVCHGWYLVSF